MSNKKRAVSIRRFPFEISSQSETELIHDLQATADSGSCRFVLDCSSHASMDLPAVRLLLTCLEEVMKYNGDVRLAGIRPEAYAGLQELGLNRLFEVYRTTESAVRSYQFRGFSLAPAMADIVAAQDTEYAA